METWKRQFIKKLFHYDVDRLDIEGAYMVKHPHVPSSLYKFRSFTESHKDAFLNNTLWTASAGKLNDPNECGAFFRPDAMVVDDLSREELEARVKELRTNSSKVSQHYNAGIRRPITSSEFMEKLMDEVFLTHPHEHEEEVRKTLKFVQDWANHKLVQETSEGMRKNVGVLSLSATLRSTLMWSHYSDSHKGFAIEYDFGALNYSDLRRRMCYPVFYSKKQRDITNYLRKRPGEERFNNLFGHYIAIIKEDDWAYEKEWRIVTLIGESYATRPLPMPKPRSVILGRNCSDENKRWMHEICSDRSIHLTQVSASDRGGNLTLETIANR